MPLSCPGALPPLAEKGLDLGGCVPAKQRDFGSKRLDLLGSIIGNGESWLQENLGRERSVK